MSREEDYEEAVESKESRENIEEGNIQAPSQNTSAPWQIRNKYNNTIRSNSNSKSIRSKNDNSDAHGVDLGDSQLPPQHNHCNTSQIEPKKFNNVVESVFQHFPSEYNQDKTLVGLYSLLVIPEQDIQQKLQVGMNVPKTNFVIVQYNFITGLII